MEKLKVTAEIVKIKKGGPKGLPYAARLSTKYIGIVLDNTASKTQKEVKQRVNRMYKDASYDLFWEQPEIMKKVIL